MAKRALVLLLVIFAASSLIAIPVSAQSSSIPKPSVPEFTLKFVDKSYDVPSNVTTTSSTDPYTNKTTITTIPMQGYHVEDLKIEVTVRNQPFAPYINGHSSSLFYNVRTKGHFEKGWNEWWVSSSSFSLNGLFPANSSSDCTVLSIGGNYPSGGKVDFQVEAILGYQYMISLPDHSFPVIGDAFEYNSSGWSGTQTVTIPNTPTVAPGVLPASSPEPTLFSLDLEQVAIIVLSVIVDILLIIDVVLLRRKREVTTHA